MRLLSGRMNMNLVVHPSLLADEPLNISMSSIFKLFSKENESIFAKVFSSTRSNISAGEAVTLQSSLQIAAFTACVKAISDTIGTLDLYTYRKLEDGSRVKATEHPVFQLLARRPNNYTNPTDFKVSLLANALIYGNGYALVKRHQARATDLFLLNPVRMEIHKIGDELTYVYLGDEGSNYHAGTYSSLDIIHIKNTSIDGVLGINPIYNHARCLGLNLAGDKLAEAMFENGNIIGMKYRFPQKLPPKERADLESNLDGSAGVSSAFKHIIMDAGGDVDLMALPTEQAHFMASRQFQQRDIFRLFRVPPHIVGDLEKSSFNNIALQSSEFLRFTLKPWINKFQEEVNRKLFFDEEVGEYYAEFFTSDLTKGSQQEIDDSNQKNLLNGFLTPNQIMQSMNLPTIGEAGEKHYFPLNYTTLEQMQKQQEEQSQLMGEVQELKSMVLPDFSGIEADIIKQLKTKEINAIRKAAKRREGEDFAQYVTEWYGKHESLVIDRLRTLFELQNKSVEELNSFANAYCQSAINMILHSEDIETTLNTYQEHYEKE